MWLGWGSSVAPVSDFGCNLYHGPKTHLSLATRHRDVHKSSGVCYSLLGSALGRLLLLLRLNLISPTMVSPVPRHELVLS